MKGLKYISIFLILSLLITACSLSSLNAETENEEAEDEVVIESIPAEGGTLTLAATRFRTLNPLFNKNEDLFQIHHLVYEGLVTFNEDMSIEPLLAETWDFSNDMQSIDFNLRSGVKWHDGKPFTADDVIFTFNVIKGNMKEVNKTSIYKESLRNVQDMKKIDEDTIRVIFSQNPGNILETMTFPILPEHVFKEGGINLLNRDDFIIPGTGIYEIQEYESMRNISLVYSKDSWRDKPYIKEISVLIVPDEEAKLSLFENGDVDLVTPKVVDWGKYVDEKNTRSVEFVTPNYEFLGINFRKNIMQNIHIRKAIAYSIDRGRIANNIYLGHGTVVDFPVMPNSWLYDNSKIKLGFNPALASFLLGEAGYILDENTGFMKNEKGETLQLKLITNTNNPLREQTAIFIQEDLKKAGIQLDIEFLEWEDLEKERIRANYDLLLGGWELSHIPNITSAFHSYYIGSTNFIAYNNESMDELLDSYLTSGDLTFKKEKFSELEEHIATELPYISLFFRNGSILVNNKIKGDMKPHSYNIFSNIYEWYINVKDHTN